MIDTATRKVIATVDVGSFPEGINYDPATQNIYVANWFDGSVSVIDASSNKLVANIDTGTESRSFGRFIVEAH